MDHRWNKWLVRAGLVMLAAGTLVAALSYEPGSSSRRARAAESYLYGLKALVGMEQPESAAEVWIGRLLALAAVVLLGIARWCRSRGAAVPVVDAPASMRPAPAGAALFEHAPAPLPPPTGAGTWAAPSPQPPARGRRIRRAPFVAIGVGALAAAVVVGLLVVRAGRGADAGDLPGTYAHAEEGTIVIDADGDGRITQSGDPVAFEWIRDGDVVSFAFDGAGEAEATVTDESLVFRPGDFSGNDPVTFTKDVEASSSTTDGGQDLEDIDVSAAESAFATFVDGVDVDVSGYAELPACPFGPVRAIATAVDDRVGLPDDLLDGEETTFVRSSTDRPDAVFCDLEALDAGPGEMSRLSVGANALVPDYTDYLEGFGAEVDDTQRDRNGQLYVYCGELDGDSPTIPYCAAEWVADGSDLVFFVVLDGARDESLAVQALTTVLPRLNQWLGTAEIGATPVSAAPPVTTTSPATTTTSSTAPATTAPSSSSTTSETTTKPWDRLVVGECVLDLPIADFVTLTVVDCAEPHRYEVIGVRAIPTTADPAAACAEIFTEYAGADVTSLGAAIDWLEPAEGSPGLRLFCLATPSDGQAMTGSWKP